MYYYLVTNFGFEFVSHTLLDAFEFCRNRYLKLESHERVFEYQFFDLYSSVYTLDDLSQLVDDFPDTTFFDYCYKVCRFKF